MRSKEVRNWSGSVLYLKFVWLGCVRKCERFVSLRQAEGKPHSKKPRGRSLEPGK
jgi:hypothetical protein